MELGCPQRLVMDGTKELGVPWVKLNRSEVWCGQRIQPVEGKLAMGGEEPPGMRGEGGTGEGGEGSNSQTERDGEGGPTQVGPPGWEARRQVDRGALRRERGWGRLG